MEVLIISHYLMMTNMEMMEMGAMIKMLMMETDLETMEEKRRSRRCRSKS